MEILLNEQQEKVVQAAIKWFRYSSSGLFQFAGLAGTGKSVVVSEIVKRLGLRYDEILPMAYTGQACIVMRTKGLPNACTCHSGLFTPILVEEKDNSGRVIVDRKFNMPITKWIFVPRDFTHSDIKLIILDEAWMIPKSFKKHIENTGIKVIATGDQGQLPPISAEPGYLVDGDIMYLTELMRQAKDSPLVYLAHRARNGLPIEYGLYGNDALVIFDDELNNDFISKSNIVLCGRNATREDLNRRVRHEILNTYTDYPLYGERMICRKNNWELEIDGISLVNGLTGTVVRPPDVGRFDGDTMSIDFQADLLSRPFTDLKINHKYLNAPYRDKEKIKTNPWLQGEVFEYAYASTVHLAQGSEYPCGIYIEEFLRSDIQNALNYTAITRFKNKMVYVKIKPKYWFF